MMGDILPLKSDKEPQETCEEIVCPTCGLNDWGIYISDVSIDMSCSACETICEVSFADIFKEFCREMNEPI